MRRAAVLIGLLLAAPTWGCDAGCPGHVDVRRNFTVEIQFEGKPLEGAEVKLGDRTFTTGEDGRATIQPLPPGDYTMTASKLGVLIASECSVRVSRWGRGKRELKYTMTEKPWPVAKMSGRLTEWRYEHRTIRLGPKQEIPSRGMKLTLRSFDGASRQVTAADDGSFDFGEMPEGLYVLQSAADNFLPRLFRLEANAKHRDLTLMWEDVICGGKAFFFRDEVKE